MISVPGGEYRNITRSPVFGMRGAAARGGGHHSFRMPMISLLALAVIFADTVPRIRYEEPQLRAEVDSAPRSVAACPKNPFLRVNWQRAAAALEGISYATPPGFPRVSAGPSQVPYTHGSIVLEFRRQRGTSLALHLVNEPSLQTMGFMADRKPTRHDYTWCRERVGGREMLITAYKLTAVDYPRTYVIAAIWPVRKGVWLSLSGEAASPALQRELLAIIRTVRVQTPAPDR